MKLTKETALDLLSRALWTFGQAAAAVLVMTNEPFSKAALIAAFAAGVSAVKTWAKVTLKK